MLFIYSFSDNNKMLSIDHKYGQSAIYRQLNNTHESYNHKRT